MTLGTMREENNGSISVTMIADALSDFDCTTDYALPETMHNQGKNSFLCSSIVQNLQSSRG